MAFPVPTAGNQTFVDLMSYSNTVSDGWMGIGMLMAIFIIFFTTLLGFSPLRAFSTSSFITAIIAILFAGMQIISVQVLVITIILFSAGIAVLYFMERNA